MPGAERIPPDRALVKTGVSSSARAQAVKSDARAGYPKRVGSEVELIEVLPIRRRAGPGAPRGQPTRSQEGSSDGRPVAPSVASPGGSWWRLQSQHRKASSVRKVECQSWMWSISRPLGGATAGHLAAVAPGLQGAALVGRDREPEVGRGEDVDSVGHPGCPEGVGHERAGGGHRHRAHPGDVTALVGLAQPRSSASWSMTTMTLVSGRRELVRPESPASGSGSVVPTATFSSPE